MTIQGKEGIEERWHETIDYVAQTQIGEGFHIHSVALRENRRMGPGDPSYLLAFELVPMDVKIPRTIVREFNALKAKRYVESLKKTPN